MQLPEPGSRRGEELDFSKVLAAAAEDEAARKTERTRTRLLAGLAGQIAAGVTRSDLKVATVTAHAGLAHGTFYRYFTDIDAATETLVADFSFFVRDRLAGARDGETGSRERVRGATLAYTRLFRQNAALMQFLLGIGSENSSFVRSYQELNRQWYARTAAAIARRREAAGGGPVSPAALLPTVYALGGMIDEFLTQIYLRRDPALAHLAGNEEGVADLLAELWWRGAYGGSRRGRN